MSTPHPLLASLDACEPARDFASAYPTLESAWHACERGDWLLWLAGRLPAFPRPLLVLAACACAREALIHVPANEPRPLRAIEAAEAWARGGHNAPTLADVRAAAYAAADAAAAAYAATYAAANAADAAYAATYAADDAANDAAGAARKTSLAKSATIVRALIPWAVVAAAIDARAK